MKKLIAVLSLSLFLFATLTGCQQKSDDSKSNEQTAKVQYTCPMHPEVVSNEPGKCSKCGMELVKKEETMEGSEMDTTGHDHQH